jgi:hypothetical protein
VQIDARTHLTESVRVACHRLGQFLEHKRRNEISACSFVALIIWLVIIESLGYLRALQT